MKFEKKVFGNEVISPLELEDWEWGIVVSVPDSWGHTKPGEIVIKAPCYVNTILTRGEDGVLFLFPETRSYHFSKNGDKKNELFIVRRLKEYEHIVVSK